MFTHVAHSLCVFFFIYFGCTLISLIKHLFQASLSKKKKNMPTVKKLKTKQKFDLCIAKLAKKHVHACLFFINRKMLNQT